MRGPRNLGKGELRRVGVELVWGPTVLVFECRACGTPWSIKTRPGSRLRRGYWKCPRKCNQPTR